MYMTQSELKETTGLQRPSAVCRWLKREGFPFLMGADGWPRVLRATILGRLGGVQTPSPAAREPQLRLRNA